MTIPSNFDRVLQTWLSEAAPTSAPVGLHARSMDLTRQRGQRVAWTVALRDALAVRPSGRVSLVARIAAVTILTLLVGMIFFAGIGRQPNPPVPVPSPTTLESPSPSPVPTPSRMGDFLRPFTYALPAGGQLSWEPTTRNLFRFGVDRFGLVQHGVAAAIVEAPWVHQCVGTGGGHVTIRRTPSELLIDLEAIGGIDFTDATETTLGNLNAITANRTQTATDCVADLHLTNESLPYVNYFTLTTAGRTVVAEVDGLTVMVDIWALSESGLEEWLPSAMEFVDSIQFIAQSPTPPPSRTADLEPRTTPPIASALGSVFSYVPPPAGSVRWVTTPDQFGFEDAEAARRGVSVVSMDHAWVHDCDSGNRTEIGRTPTDVLDDLSAVGGFSYTARGPTAIHDRPAIVARRTEASTACFGDLHTDPLTQGLGNSFIPMWPAADSILVDVNGRTILIEIWAQTEADLEAWLPTAMDFVNSIQFTSQPRELQP